MAKYFLALLMLLAAASGFARGAPEAETFLWQLSQPGRPVSYLLGTLHVGKTGARLPAHYQRALEQSAQLVVESNADELAEHPLRVGLSTTVDVNLRDQSGPVLAQQPPQKASFSTTVYDRQLAEADAMITQLIHDNSVAAPKAAQR